MSELRKWVDGFIMESREAREVAERKCEAFVRETRADNRKLNRQLGEIANKHWRLVEDIVAPSFFQPRRARAG